MSYDKIKGISTNEKNMTISITLASSNLYPTIYEKVILKSDSKDDYKDELINVFTNFATGTFKFNASVANKFSVAYNLAKIFRPELFTYDAYRVDGMLEAGKYTYDIFKKLSNINLSENVRVNIITHLGNKVDIKSIREVDSGLSIKVTLVNVVTLDKAICWYSMILDSTFDKTNPKIIDRDGKEINLIQLISWQVIDCMVYYMYSKET